MKITELLEALDENFIIELMAKHLRKKGYQKASLFYGERNAITHIFVSIDNFQIRIFYRDGMWIVTSFTPPSRFERHDKLSENGVLEVLDSYRKTAEKDKLSPIGESLEHVFHKALQKMAERDRGLWVLVKHFPNGEEEQARVTRIEELEAGGKPIFRVHIMATDYITRGPKNRQLAPTWFELNDDDDEVLVVKNLNDKRTLMYSSGGAIRI